MRSINLISLVLISIFVTNHCKNNRPLIGILSQDRLEKDGSFIVASYVKYLESAGARVVPIFINENYDYYVNIVNQTDGLLIPGGGQDLHTSGYAKAGQMIWNLTLSNKLAKTYPIWGTCLGFELLLTLVEPDLKLDTCNSSDVVNELTFTDQRKTSRLFKEADPNIIKILQTERVTYNHHQKCLKANRIAKNGTKKIDTFFNVLSTSKDYNGLEYISTIESKTGDIYGVQWHPEKNLFEFALNQHNHNIPHSSNAALISQYMANFFVNRVREVSTRGVLGLDIEHKMLIYNYNPEYTGNKVNYGYEQIYYFNRTNL